MEATLKTPNYRYALHLSNSLDACECVFEEVVGIAPDDQSAQWSKAQGKVKFRLPDDFKYKDLELKRGVVRINSDFANWCREVLEGGLTDTVITRTIKVTLQRRLDEEVIESWEFVNAYPLNWTLGPESDTKQLRIDCIKFSYSYLARA